jgi:hypothetical protein
MTRKYWELLLIGLVPLALEACASDTSDSPPPSPYDASFASASDAQRQRAVSAIFGMEADVAEFVARSIDHGGPCPSSSLGPKGEAVLQGGCTTASGTRIEGTIRREGGYLDPTSFTFEHFAMHGETEIAIDGAIRIEKPNHDTVVRYIDLSTKRGGAEVRATMIQRCDLDGCKRDPGAEVSIAAVGRAQATLEAGKVTLVGRDWMTAELAAGDCATGNVGSESGTQALAPFCLWDATAMPVFDARAKVPGLKLSCTPDDRMHAAVTSTVAGQVTLDLEYFGAYANEYVSAARWDDASQNYVADWSADGCAKKLEGLTGYVLSIADGTSHGRAEMFAVPRVTIGW